jgi:TniQ
MNSELARILERRERRAVLPRQDLLPRIPVCPIPLADECLSSWIERTACFYGCEMDRWVGQFFPDLRCFGEPALDWDLSDEARNVLSAWSAISESKLPRLSDAALVLPMNARLTFCEQCWDDDVRNGGQPYIRRTWLNWATVHCDRHRAFLSSTNRSVTANASHVSWQELWSRKAGWCEAFELKRRGTGLGSLWFEASRKLLEPLRRSLVRLGDSTDASAMHALDQTIGAWRLSGQLPGRPELPVLLENRIEMLSQAAAVLADSSH